ncbi:MAG: hypothetical protein Q8N35_11920 [Methylococcaceae bacterium]|nr:hypothetical protein [Methylococcaceae bacterium]MDZ4156712.1 hypothetical protein [Methylococcales bacterium]MDP2394862.1 hypothetical protein [Methylococcaceae bacterium]MDP3020283.1 hypothetical protein [Methylococcaceae bacterium]MDP3390824.1 hypothetical protein [Methylococcaceae bacterium]
MTIFNWFKHLVLRQQRFTVILILLFTAVTIKLITLYVDANMGEGQWEQFKIDHHCQPQVADNGDRRLSWQCDDGDRYYRWRQQR